MATSIHVPPALLAAVDRRARRLSISRNKLIVRTLADSLARQDEWDAVVEMSRAEDRPRQAFTSASFSASFSSRDSLASSCLGSEGVSSAPAEPMRMP